MAKDSVFNIITDIRMRLRAVVSKPEGYYVHMNIRKALERLDDLEKELGKERRS